MFNLNQQIAIVTGGAKGIGKGIVNVLKNAGTTVSIADIDEKQGALTAQELGCTFKYVDVTSQSACQRLIDEVIQAFRCLDILCSNTVFSSSKS